MVVVAILVSLTTILAVNVKAAWDRAKVDETRLTMGTLDMALQGWAAQHRGTYPSTSQGLEAARPFLRSGGPALPLDAWGRPFAYRSPAGEAAYAITSLGADGREGGDDIDADLVIVGR
ncbi:MAG: type II secretion system protein GspG [Pseudomonadota bacterium]